MMDGFLFLIYYTRQTIDRHDPATEFTISLLAVSQHRKEEPGLTVASRLCARNDKTTAEWIDGGALAAMHSNLSLLISLKARR